MNEKETQLLGSPELRKSARGSQVARLSHYCKKQLSTNGALTVTVIFMAITGVSVYPFAFFPTHDISGIR